MDPKDFCLWLNGYLELKDPATLTREERIILDHLQLVFTKVTPNRDSYLTRGAGLTPKKSQYKDCYYPSKCWGDSKTEYAKVLIDKLCDVSAESPLSLDYGEFMFLKGLLHIYEEDGI